jgi:prevent-host-death family protein
MIKVNMHEAKTTLSKLVERALSGEDVIVAKSGKPLVRLVPVDPNLGRRPMGMHAVHLSDEEAQEAFRPLSEQEWGLG